MDTSKPVANPAPKPLMIPSAGGNIPLAALMQQIPPSLYANGFGVSVTGADVCLSLVQNDRMLATVNLSFITAKALGNGLSNLIKELEEKSHTKVPSVEEVAQALHLHNP